MNRRILMAPSSIQAGMPPAWGGGTYGYDMALYLDLEDLLT